MAGVTRKDPLPVFCFKVEIDSIDTAFFRKVSGLKTETEIFEYQEGGDNETTLKLIGPTKASNLVLTQGFVNDPALYKWREEIASSGTNPIKRRNGSIVQLDTALQEVTRWNFTKAWPVRWEMGEFDSSTGQAQVEVLELAVEKISKG
ncbi:MAG TPA: phage tail protein [Candidatus Sulfotelmatobacter sp.]|nr:phage tail protein [Candidatus Sulfotelmatobacter sp.]HUJ25775.1 phage tail protein [Myxococcales bacterium]